MRPVINRCAPCSLDLMLSQAASEGIVFNSWQIRWASTSTIGQVSGFPGKIRVSPTANLLGDSDYIFTASHWGLGHYGPAVHMHSQGGIDERGSNDSGRLYVTKPCGNAPSGYAATRAFSSRLEPPSPPNPLLLRYQWAKEVSPGYVHLRAAMRRGFS